MRILQRPAPWLMGVLLALGMIQSTVAQKPSEALSFHVLIVGVDGGLLENATVSARGIDGVVKADATAPGLYLLEGRWKTSIPIAVEHATYGAVQLDIDRPVNAGVILVNVTPKHVADEGLPANGTTAGQLGPVNNDLCVGAVPLAVPSLTQGSTVNATFDDVGFCDTSNSAPGVWYSVIGDGTRLTASFCSDGGEADFDTKLSVFRGGCEDLICVAGNDDNCPGFFLSEVEWCGEPGVEYLILVHAFVRGTGDFILSLQSGNECGTPPNDLCTNAIPLDVPSKTAGTTLDAGIDNVPFCGTSNTAPGVWYSVTGTGNTMTASTCGPLFENDTKISVFCSCDDLVCIGGNDDDCLDGASGTLSTVSWCSQEGATYLILVHGFGSASGGFDLFLSDDGLPCDQAISCEIDTQLHLDIKPGSCPNSFNRGSNGVLPVGLLGTAGFDITEVDVSSVVISRADGVGGSVAPNEGPPGPHSVFADVGTPFGGDGCDCHMREGDGITDLSMKFKTQEMVEALELDDLAPGSFVELCVSGTLLDGTEFIVCDCVRLVPWRESQPTMEQSLSTHGQ